MGALGTISVKTSKRRKLSRLIACGLIAAATSLGAAMANSPSSPQSSAPQKTRTSTDAPISSEGKLGQDLFIAIGRGNMPGLEALLKQGADPNSRNGLQFTPLYLAAATAQTNAIEMLLKSGAKLDAASPYGTPLVFAAMSGAVPAMNMLIARGANINATRADGIDVLMFASRSGAADVVSELLSRKANVNAKDNDGVTALIYAARDDRDDAGKVLIEKGAIVNVADSHGWTPLMYAAVNGHTKFVQLLLENKANPNLKDKSGCTALMLSAEYGDYPEVTRALLQAGANPHIKGSGGSTAVTLAASRGHSDCAALLGDSKVTAATSSRTALQAVKMSLPLLEHSMLQFNQRTGCISCHQEGLGRMASAEALNRGFALDPAVDKAQSERINGALHALCPLHEQAVKDPEAMKKVPLFEIGEVTTGDAFLLAGMAAHKQAATEDAGAMAMVLAQQQMPDGSWQFHLPRIPMQSSFFTFTALAIRSLQAYAPAASSTEIVDRIGKAKQWLLTAPAMTTEDRSFRLIGLMWAGATVQERQAAVDDLKTQQRPDGGWAQDAGLQSDAYATGEALYALSSAGGLPTSDSVFRRGVELLLRTQDPDGSWFVNKRAMPANNYFDAGFPHGQSQFSSFNGTCWAVMALLQTVQQSHKVAGG